MSIMSDMSYALRKNLLYTYKGKEYDIADRQTRIDLIDVITREKKFNSQELTQLADLILYEELSDTHPDKMTREEYPIMSDIQLARRQEGKHVKRKDKDGKMRPNKTEVPMKAAYDYGADGKDYRVPRRRRLSTDEALVVDSAKTRNMERRQKYEAFVKPGKVEVSYIGD